MLPNLVTETWTNQLSIDHINEDEFDFVRLVCQEEAFDDIPVKLT